MLIGSIVLFAGISAPNGWLLCDGSAVSRSTYDALFNVIGTEYGEGDTSTTFNLPDLTGRVLIGSSSTHPSASIGGEEFHTLTYQEIPSHSHVVCTHGHENNITFTTPPLSHAVTQAVFTYSAPGGTSTVGSGGGGSGYSGTTNTNGTRTDASISDHYSENCTMSGSVTDCDEFDTDLTGIDEQHNNMQPFITLKYIIYAGE